MAQLRSQFAQLMAPGLKHVYDDATMFEQKEKSYPALFNEETSTREYEQVLEMSALGPLQEKPENTPTAYNDMMQGGSKRAIHLTYSLGIRTSKELKDDDQYGLVMTGPKALARSTRFTQEVVAWNVINQGFTTNLTTFDGKSLFNNQHLLLGGTAATAIGPGLGSVISAAGTFPNRPAVDVDFSTAGIQLAVNQSNRMVDNQGFPTNLRFKYVLIPPEQIWLAREILGSPGKPGTPNNDINALLAEGLTYISTPYLTSTSAWYMVTEKREHSLTVFMREQPNTKFDDDFDTDAIKQKTRMRMSAFCPRWQGIWGSNGP